MGKLLIGLAIALLDFPLQLAGGRVLDLTPDVLGYILIIFGLREIGRFSLKFASAYKITWFAAIAAGAVFGANLLTGQDYLSMVIILVGIAELFLQVALMVFLALGFFEMEQELQVNLHSKWLKIIAICIAPGILLAYTGILVPVLEVIATPVVDILYFAYLILFYFSREAYNAANIEE